MCARVTMLMMAQLQGYSQADLAEFIRALREPAIRKGLGNAMTKPVVSSMLDSVVSTFWHPP